VDDGGCPILEY